MAVLDCSPGSPLLSRGCYGADLVPNGGTIQGSLPHSAGVRAGSKKSQLRNGGQPTGKQTAYHLIRSQGSRQMGPNQPSIFPGEQ
jgi:hypothetical protein